jgi:hypothetical protein
MKAKSVWNSFWFSPAPYFDLAVLRIIAVAVQCFYMINEQFSDLNYVYSLPRSLYHPLLVLHLYLWPWGLANPPASQVVFSIYGLCLLFGFAALVGLFTNISLFLFAIGCIFLQSLVFSFQQYHHPEAIMMIGLLVLSLGPSGKVLSLDSLLRRWRHGNAISVPLLEYSGQFAAWPVRFIQCLYPLIYISSAVAKLAYNHYTLDWANGFTLQYYLIQDHIRKGIPLAYWISQFHFPIHMGQIVILIYQCTYWLVVPFRRLRWIYLPLGATFHLANYLILDAPFPQWLALLAAYIPWALGVRLLAAKQVVPTTPVGGT